MSETPLEGWAALRLSGKGDGKLEVPSRDAGVQTGFGPARYAIGPSGEPRLLIPVSDPVQLRNLGASGKLLVATRRYNVAGKSQPFIDLQSDDRKLDAVFSELVLEILKRLQDGASPGDAVAGTISDFRKLLFAASAGEASKSAIIGLLGELHVLKLLCSLHQSAADAWVGPFEQRHDFRRMSKAIEVKTSSRSDQTHVQIHGAEQLAAPAGGDLVLVHVRLEQTQDGSVQVSRYFDELLKLGVEQKRLLAGLIGSGCPSPDDAEWNSMSFSLEGMEAYTVQADFPRIIPEYFPGKVLPGGISKLDYDLDLTFASDFLLVDADFQKFLLEFVS